MTAITTMLRDARWMRQQPTPDAGQVHCHIGGDGRPFVCDLSRCDSVGLTIDEAHREQQAAGSRGQARPGVARRPGAPVRSLSQRRS